MKLKIGAFLSAILLFTASCNKDINCVTCIAQKKTGQVIDARSGCDSEFNYLNGFENGFRDKYKNALDSVNVICN